MSKTKESFLCVLPWNHLFVSNSKKIFPCCLSQSAKYAARTENNELIDFNDSNAINLARNSPTFASIRKDMLEGVVPPSCQYCQNVENSGKSSYRNYVNSLYQKTHESLLQTSSSDAVLDIEFADIRFGNICNLKCVMCHPNSSSLLINEHVEFYGNSDANKRYSQTEAEIDVILNSTQHIDRINIAGGEPFAIPAVTKFLTLLSYNENAKEIKLTFNSNLTIFNKEIVELFPRFKSVEIAGSIDAYSELNSYIRFPSDWKAVIENLDEYRKYCSVYINCTVQILNIFNLKEFFDFMCMNKNVHFSLNLLEEPHHLSIQALPNKHKELVRDNLLKLLHEYPARKELDAIITFMFAQDKQSHFPTFIKWIQFLDKKRNQSILRVVPIFKEFFDPALDHESRF